MVVQVLVVTFLFSLAFAAPIDLSCNVPVDLVFVLDGSDSLKESEFSASKQFVLDVIQSLTLGKQNVQVGVLVYSTFVGGTIDLGAFNTFNILKIFINNLQQPRQGTATDLAIISMQNMFNKARALQPDRQSVQKIGIVLTDGRSTSPNATINAAKAAKNAGIQLYAIGYGTDVFIYELEQIASDSQKTLILTNSMTDQAFLQEFEDKLRPRVCEVSITTEKAITTVIPTLPSTEKLVPDKYCPNCMKDVNYGYKPYPGDCTKYYDVRPDENGGAIQDVKKCPFGTFWDSTYLTCQYTWMVNCVYDPCRSFSSGTLAMPGVCSGYWTCFNFRGNATCCSRPNQRYVQGVGCLEDFSCTTTCPDDDSNRIQVPQQCYRYPYQPDRSKYYEENHGFNITRSCAPGTWFDQNTCSCSITSGLNSGNIQACLLQHLYTFLMI
ncbi:protein PIF-like isoform X3 [Mytilus galloprovincialis]|uniref:protein PIF-like isoform X3 n=1 Tax=Mytilus galloprovincialis TaxID=29158 RepID=UPI003F7B9EFD